MIEPAVIVGIDGSVDALHAVDWAADEAARHRWPVRLVHAYHAPIAALPAVMATLPPPIDASARIRSEARRRVADAHPDLTVAVVHREGPAPSVLLGESEQARMLVVGREGLGRIAELLLGSVSLACATRARVPVAVIPYAWKPPATPHGRVVVGVDGSPNCEAAVQYAFQTAADRGSEVVAVHAWHHTTRWPEGWPDGWPPGTDTQPFLSNLDHMFAESMAQWSQKYPDVHVTTATGVGHPAIVLERYVAAADLVVIGGRGHGVVTGMLLGSVARAIVRHLDRPVVVVREPSRADAPA
jgi:nucleotide-binding universal stress UspA family protein